MAIQLLRELNWDRRLGGGGVFSHVDLVCGSDRREPMVGAFLDTYLTPLLKTDLRLSLDAGKGKSLSMIFTILLYWGLN